MCDELAVVVRVDVGARESVSGRVESPYGSHPFSGWLDLFGRLEEVIDRARDGSP